MGSPPPPPPFKTRFLLFVGVFFLGFFIPPPTPATPAAFAAVVHLAAAAPVHLAAPVPLFVTA